MFKPLQPNQAATNPNQSIRKRRRRKTKKKKKKKRMETNRFIYSHFTSKKFNFDNLSKPRIETTAGLPLIYKNVGVRRKQMMMMMIISEIKNQKPFKQRKFGEIWQLWKLIVLKLK